MAKKKKSAKPKAVKKKKAGTPKPIKHTAATEGRRSRFIGESLEFAQADCEVALEQRESLRLLLEQQTQELREVLASLRGALFTAHKPPAIKGVYKKLVQCHATIMPYVKYFATEKWEVPPK